jgi:hypothetical protein
MFSSSDKLCVWTFSVFEFRYRIFIDKSELYRYKSVISIQATFIDVTVPRPLSTMRTEGRAARPGAAREDRGSRPEERDHLRPRDRHLPWSVNQPLVQLEPKPSTPAMSPHWGNITRNVCGCQLGSIKSIFVRSAEAVSHIHDSLLFSRRMIPSRAFSDAHHNSRE